MIKVNFPMPFPAENFQKYHRNLTLVDIPMTLTRYDPDDGNKCHRNSPFAGFPMTLTRYEDKRPQELSSEFCFDKDSDDFQD